MLKSVVRLAALAALGLAAVAAQAQGYPNRPIKLVVPYSAGGMPDSFSRSLAQRLTERLGQPVIIENKPGASLVIGTDSVAKAAPDGYTLLLGSASSLAANVGAFKKLPYDPVKDFAPVSLGFNLPFYLIVHRDVPANSVKELVALAKAKPGEYTFASLGNGTTLHLAAEMFRKMAGIDLLHVPYSTANMTPHVVSGQVHMVFDGGQMLPHVKAGSLKLLAVTTPARLEHFPNVPTMMEAGVPGYELVSWFGIVAPAGTPKAAVDLLSREIRDIVVQPAFRERFMAAGIQPVGSTPEEFAALIKRDIPKWSRLVVDAGIKPE
jgi:tripartite-type tricarboxylate transporter receptor subunit TctC